MCGLTGLIAPGGSAEDLARIVRRMSDALVHRGPDDSGDWVDAEAGVALSLRRLAIQDLSPAGHQPMVSPSGRYVATLNGEIYNFRDLRRELHVDWRGHSDTEAMLAAFDAWGVEGGVRRLNGMFAIALWDRQERRLHLIRDRMGVKPLYYGFAGGFAGKTLLWASEIKALERHPDFKPAIDRNALQLYLRFMYVPAPYSIYQGVFKQLPGTILTFDPATGATKTDVYWSAREAALRGTAHRFAGSEEDAARELEELLRDAVRIRMISDVPLGVFLSGGIDSSVVTALMQAESTAPVRSFSVGFSEAAYDEAPYAKAVARHLGTCHTEVIMTEDDVAGVIPRLPAMYDEPFADSSQIPTHLVATVARRDVIVALSGDGGDELFGGYRRYFLGQRLLRAFSAIPSPFRAPAGALLGLVPNERVRKVSRVLRANDPDLLYFELVSHWTDLVANNGQQLDTALLRRGEWPELKDPVERMMFFDQISYLPDDILAKVDRATMAASLEAREPLLDYRLVEFAWTLPLSMKVRGGRGKRVLRRVLSRYVPEALIERPKMGFGIPLETWLRGRLRDWAESLLDERALRAGGLLNPAPVRAKWREHLAGNDAWKYHLWAVLMLQAWQQEKRSPAAAP
jgi:asparagine synthase (glutamine-hydrolysing)